MYADDALWLPSNRCEDRVRSRIDPHYDGLPSEYILKKKNDPLETSKNGCRREIGVESKHSRTPTSASQVEWSWANILRPRSP